MLKLPKGLKKKKKGKKSKHKDEELFTKEELEAYRREHAHQQQAEPAASGEAAGAAGAAAPAGEKEEWRKFLSLTSDVDDVLKKTQDDLDRIKSSSFFQRVPPPSEVRRQEEEKQAEVRAEEEAKEEAQRQIAAVEAAIVEVSDSESGDEEDDDDIFDTAYIDAVAAGEVKLAYIPESPTEEGDDDIFDTTYAEKAILGPNSERKGKKLVALGSAVEILTGRVQAPSCVAVKRPAARRQVFKEQNLLLSSFDADQTSTEPAQDSSKEHHQDILSLLDDDAPEELASEPIDLSKVIVAPLQLEQKESPKSPGIPGQDILAEFGVLQKEQTPEDEDDQEFALLAAESLSKPKQSVVLEAAPQLQAEPAWNAFKTESPEEPVVDDPFDTTFAENILPGQAELKQIEREILDEENDLDFNPRADEVYSEIIRRSSIGVSIQLTNPTGQRESVSSLDRVHEDELTSLRTTHRDLLGGSNTDLSQLSEAIQPKEEEEEEDKFDYSDPFDTSAIDAVALPGTTELKFLERELLGEQVRQVHVQVALRPEPPVVEDDFDPRAFEAPPQSSFNRKVSFDLPLLPKADLLSANDDPDSRVSKPLTPYYVRENSIPQADIDPFDTTFAESIAPGQAELKQIESALLESESPFNTDFNPRDEKQVAVAKVKEEIEQIIHAGLTRKPSLPVQPPPQPQPPKAATPEPLDLLGLDNDIRAKVLTPAAENKSVEDIDPFDTSIACNILPGQTELRLLESELITNAPPVQTIRRNLTDPDFDPRDAPTTQNILEVESDTGLSDVKLLTPITGKVSFNVGFEEEEDDIDPFDTSIANNIAPGPSELKLLESELI